MNWNKAVSSLSDPALEPLFWYAERLGVPSPWWQHVPFAHWIVCAVAPRVLVELGTYTGVSYSAFCNAVRRKQTGTRCHAIGTWGVDSGAEKHAADAYDDFQKFHNQNFISFSTLLRVSPAKAIDYIGNKEVDLLHIDMLYKYDDVLRVFASWLPKLSEHAVVLLHGINKRDADADIWKFWEEIVQFCPNFEFLHGHGLGVLAVGGRSLAAVADLCALGESKSVSAFRARCKMLGDCWLLANREHLRAMQCGVGE